MGIRGTGQVAGCDRGRSSRSHWRRAVLNVVLYSVPSSRPVHSGFSSNDDPSSMHKQVQLYTGYMYFCIKVSTTTRPCCAYRSIIIAPQCVAIKSSLYIFPLINSVRSPCCIARYCSYSISQQQLHVLRPYVLYVHKHRMAEQ